MYEVNEEDQRDPELLQMYFESFKHMTTLATATAVVLAVAVGQMSAILKNEVAQAALLLTFGILGISLVVSVLGMRAATRYMRSWRSGATYYLDRQQQTAILSFIGGLVGFAINIAMAVLASL